MVTKSTKPDNIEPDFGTLKNGMIDVLIHWDIGEKTGIDSNGLPYIYWEYSEERLRVACPRGSESEIATYLTSRYQRYLIRCGVDDRLIVTENIIASMLEGSA